jgi:hypothetical protein
MVIDYLSQEDKNLIDEYRKNYVSRSGHAGEMAPADHILREWNRQKSKYLESLFGNQLIIEKPIEFEEDINEIERKCHKFMYDSFVDIDGSVTCWSQFFKKLTDPFRQEPFDHTDYLYVNGLGHTYLLANNAISSKDFYIYRQERTITLPNGKKLEFRSGAKPMRILGKIATWLGLEEELERFRNAHSLCLNTKKLKGTLCLSIHPLDYMTMSDNDCGWTSCMSWIDGGEYKQGTVTMMNSPSVVVGYLKRDEDFPVVTNYNFALDSYTRLEWNSKKWRCLFVVDPKFIASIKSYPYYNQNLTNAAMGVLSELSGWGSAPKIEAFHQDCGYTNEQGGKLNIYLETYVMYNDVGRESNSKIIINPSFDGEYAESYCFSGQPECMWCGDLNSRVWEDEGSEGALACEKCGYFTRCCCCDCYIDENEAYEVDGSYCCECCYEDHTFFDPIADNHMWDDDTVDLILSPSNDGYAKSSEYHRTVETTYNTLEYNQYAWNYWFNHPVRTRDYETPYGWHRTQYYVCPKDCSAEALSKLFDLYEDEDLEKYMATAVE